MDYGFQAHSATPHWATSGRDPLAARVEAVRERIAPYDTASDLPRRALEAFADLRRAEALVQTREARVWLELLEKKLHNHHGFRSLGDFARETGRVSPATAHRRVRLARAFDRCPLLQEAFLDGRVTAAHALLIAPLLGGDADAFWIELAGRCTFKELQERVAGARAGESPDDEAGETPTYRLSFEVPASLAVTWEAAVELASRLEGRDLSRADAFEAVLSEAESAIAAGTPADPPPTGDSVAATHAVSPVAAPIGAVRKAAGPATHAWSPSRRRIERLEKTLDSISDELADIQDLCRDAHSADPVPTLKALLQLARPLRRLRARLLNDAVAVSLPLARGHATLASWVETDLKLSERAARDLLAEARFDDPTAPVERAYAEGRISGSQTRVIRLLTESIAALQPAYVARAEAVTHLQFQRESRLLLRIRDFLPRVPASGPFPHSRLEGHLRKILGDRGLSADDIESHLSGEGLSPSPPPDTPNAPHGSTDPATDGSSIPDPPTNAPHGSTDPATDPVAFRRLEALVDLCLLTIYPDGVDEGPEHRQTLINGTAPIRVSFTLPEPIFDHWKRLKDVIRGREGPIPDWAVFGIVVCTASLEWGRQDPAGKPVHHRILERDSYHCTAPGCTSRHSLEVHHIVYRSHRGSNDPQNLTTLCAFHHRQSIHLGAASLEGAAPHLLQWTLGSARYHGNLRR